MRSLVAIVLVAAAPLVAAQDPVLSGSAITESALIDALAPPQVMTRSLRPPSATPPKPAGASLLIEFRTNSTELTPASRGQLDIVGKALNTERLASFNFQLVGHADPRGNPESNLKLSAGRAESVKRYLVQAQNIDAARLTTLGKGDTEPLNRADPAAPENRRVQVVRAAN